MVDAQKKGATLIPDMGDWWGMIMAIIPEMGKLVLGEIMDWE